MKPRRGSDPGAEPKTAPTWVKLLVGFHVLATTIWALPNLPQAIYQGQTQPHGTQWLLFWNQAYLKPLPPVQTYLLSTGAWQYWDMFAPDPSSADFYCTAEVTYRDGTMRVVPYPRMADLPIPLKYVKERYRKFYERAGDENQPGLWPTFARVMALWGYTDKTNPPVRVALRRHRLQIVEPGKPQPTTYDSGIYYTYEVEQKWLRKAAGR